MIKKVDKLKIMWYYIIVVERYDIEPRLTSTDDNHTIIQNITTTKVNALSTMILIYKIRTKFKSRIRQKSDVNE